ncbi:MAG: prolipoprotein diacylglyceryl transferase [Desulfobacterales bacterium]|nr:prolipoprotein diacylglyceryl transferase [Desulfobacterales bacterium]
MHPILLKLGKLEIYTYGFFIAVGFLVGIFLAKRQAAKEDISPDMILDLGFYILIAAIIGSRIFYIGTNIDFFMNNPIEMFKIWNGGLVFYGGFLGGLITGVLYLKKQKVSIWKTADILAPSLAIGHFFGRIGCLFAGCCYGKQCDLPWSITFKNPQSLAPIGISLHPTQIYDAISNLIIFSFLLFFRRYKKFDGQIFWLYAMFYGIFRIIVEAFRGDFRGVTILNTFSISQVIGLSIGVIAIFMLNILSRDARPCVSTDKIKN